MSLPSAQPFPVTPLFVLMAARRRELASAWLAFVPPVLLLAAIAALPHALARFGLGLANPYLREALTQADAFGEAYRVAAPILLLAMLAPAALGRYDVWRRLVAGGVLCSFAVGALLLPALGRLQQAPVKEAALFARNAGLPVRTWQFNAPSFSVYRGQVTDRAVALKPCELVLTRSSELAALGPAEILYRRGGVVLARVPR